MPTKNKKANASATEDANVNANPLQSLESTDQDESTTVKTFVREKKNRALAVAKFRDISIYRGPQYEDSFERVAIVSISGPIKAMIETKDGEVEMISRRPAISISAKQVEILMEACGLPKKPTIAESIDALKQYGGSRQNRNGLVEYASIELNIEHEDDPKDLEEARMFPSRIIPLYSNQHLSDLIEIEKAKVRARFELEMEYNLLDID